MGQQGHSWWRRRRHDAAGINLDVDLVAAPRSAADRRPAAQGGWPSAAGGWCQLRTDAVSCWRPSGNGQWVRV